MTPTSSTRLDHYITKYAANDQKQKVSMSDHYTVLGEIPAVKIEQTKSTDIKIRTGNLIKVKGDRALFLLWNMNQ